MAPETGATEMIGAISAVGEVTGELKGDENHESHDGFGLVLGDVADFGVGGPEEETVEVEWDELGRESVSTAMVRKADGNMLGWEFAGMRRAGEAGLEP